MLCFGLSCQYPGHASTAGSSPCLPLLLSFLKPLFSTASNYPATQATQDHKTSPPIPPLSSFTDIFQFLKWIFFSPPTLHQANSSSSLKSQSKTTFLGPPLPALALQSIPASTSGSTVLAYRALTSAFCYLAQL